MNSTVLMSAVSLALMAVVVPNITAQEVEPVQRGTGSNAAEVEGARAGECTVGLTRAVGNGDRGRVESMLLNGADANCTDQEGDSPLNLAVNAGNLGMTELLLEAGANPDRRDHRGNAPLHTAIERNSVPIFEVLLEAGADPRSRDGRGRTVVELAQQANTGKVLKLLRESRAR